MKMPAVLLALAASLPLSLSASAPVPIYKTYHVIASWEADDLYQIENTSFFVETTHCEALILIEPANLILYSKKDSRNKIIFLTSGSTCVVRRILTETVM